jgi:hypothetical protein
MMAASGTREEDASAMRTRLIAILLGFIVAAIAPLVRAEDDDPTAWHVTITPYAWAPGLYGDVTVRGRTASLDQSFLDTLEKTDLAVGLAGHLEVTRGRFGIFSDGVYMKTKVVDAGITGLDVTTRLWLVELGAQYRLVDTTDERVPGLTVDVYGGGRYSSLELGLDTQGAPSTRQTKSWVDPIVGGRVGLHFSEHVFLLIGGDIGGFGVGSDLAWSVLGLLGYRWQAVGLEWTLLAGYKALGQDYTTGSGARRFRWDTTMHGPVLGLSVRF